MNVIIYFFILINYSFAEPGRWGDACSSNWDCKSNLYCNGRERVCYYRNKPNNDQECEEEYYSQGKWSFQERTQECWLTEDGCKVTADCKLAGKCILKRASIFDEGYCGVEPGDCKKACKVLGQCIYDGTGCVPTKQEHCENSRMCKERGEMCFLGKQPHYFNTSIIYLTNCVDRPTNHSDLSFQQWKEKKENELTRQQKEDNMNELREMLREIELEAETLDLSSNNQDAPQSYKKALQLYRKSCDGGDAKGCTDLGYQYHYGKGVSQSYKKALQLYRKACDGGDAKGCTYLGHLYQKACDGGSAYGCAYRGILYLQGKGVSQSDKKAYLLSQKGCDGGSAKGCFTLGFLYHSGKGVSQSDEKASRFYRKACDGGNALGCSVLGFFYLQGKGVSQSDKKAYLLSQKGCDGGSAKGCFTLSFLYHSGKGVSQSDEKASLFKQKACVMGNKTSCK